MSDEYRRYQVVLNLVPPKYNYNYNYGFGSTQASAQNNTYQNELKEYNEKLGVLYFKTVNTVVEAGGIIEIQKWYTGDPTANIIVMLSDEILWELKRNPDIAAINTY
jgi:hypothetical protein